MFAISTRVRTLVHACSSRHGTGMGQYRCISLADQHTTLQTVGSLQTLEQQQHTPCSVCPLNMHWVVLTAAYSYAST
jgi:hypothetical protein